MLQVGVSHQNNTQGTTEGTPSPTTASKEIYATWHIVSTTSKAKTCKACQSTHYQPNCALVILHLSLHRCAEQALRKDFDICKLQRMHHFQVVDLNI